MAKDELVESQDDRDDAGIFIHSELDDYGLNPLEFRVYGRLARRAGKGGTARQSVPHMAEEFGVHKRSVQRALRLLTLCGLTTAQPKEGRPTLYRLNPRRKWRNPKDLTMIREYVRDSKGATLEAWVAERDGGVPPSPAVRHEEPGGMTPQAHEGIPLKVLPEGTPDPAMRARGQVKPERPNQEPKEPKIKCPANILETYPEIVDQFPEHNGRLATIITGWRNFRLGQTRDTMRTEEQWYHDCLSWISREKVTNGNGNGRFQKTSSGTTSKQPNGARRGGSEELEALGIRPKRIVGA